MNSSLCCSAPIQAQPHLSDSDVKTEHCTSCGTYWMNYVRLNTGTTESRQYWSSPGITSEFLGALQYRRDVQARQILTHFKTLLSPDSKLLDYGCGQGLFLKHLRNRSYDAYGTDLQRLESPELKNYFAPIDQPWGWPKLSITADTLVLLDVLEHIPDPVRFLKMANQNGTKNLIIKVPMVNGPLALAARLAARLGIRSLWNTMILKTDIAPHLAFHTDAGLRSLVQKAGFGLIKRTSITEVGAELPDRIRITGLGFLRPFLKIAGWVLGKLGMLWSDTAIYYFRSTKA